MKILFQVFTFSVLLLASCTEEDDILTDSILSKRIVTTVIETPNSIETTVFATTFSYGSNGYFDKMDFDISNELQSTDANGNLIMTSFSTTQKFSVDNYNSSNQLMSDTHTYTTQDDDIVHDYGNHTYNSSGYLVQTIVTYHSGLVTTITYEYNQKGQKIKEVSTEKPDEFYEYNDEGALVKHTMNGTITTYTLDGKENPM